MPEPRYAPIRDRVKVATPAAGANWTFTNDRGELLLVRFVTFTLVASAAVANRTVGVTCSTGEDVWFRSGATVVQTNGVTRNYCAMPGSSPGGDSAAAITLPWPGDGLILQPGYILASAVSLIDVADQLAAIVLDVLRFTPSFPTRLEPVPSLYERHAEESYSGTGLLSQSGG